MSSKRVQRKELDVISYHNYPILMATQVKDNNQLYVIGLDRKQVILWGHPKYNKKLYLKAFVKKVTRFIRKVRYKTFYYSKEKKVLFVGRTDGIIDVLLFKRNEDESSDFQRTLEYQLSVNVGRGQAITHITETMTPDGVPILLVSYGHSVGILDQIYSDSIDVAHVLNFEKENNISRVLYTPEQRLLLVADKNYQISFFRLDLVGQNLFPEQNQQNSDELSVKITYLATLSTDDGHRGLIYSFSYDKDMQILLTGGAKNVCVWNINGIVSGVHLDPNLLYTIIDNIGTVNGVAFWGEALLAVTGDGGGAVIVTDVNKKVVIARFTAHYGPCSGLELDQQSGILLTWGKDRLLKLWRLWEEAEDDA